MESFLRKMKFPREHVVSSNQHSMSLKNSTSLHPKWPNLSKDQNVSKVNTFFLFWIKLDKEGLEALEPLSVFYCFPRPHWGALSFLSCWCPLMSYDGIGKNIPAVSETAGNIRRGKPIRLTHVERGFPLTLVRFPFISWSVFRARSEEKHTANGKKPR